MAFLIAIPLFFVLVGCQTNQIRQFSKLKPGMDKGQVLEVMGSPQSTRRFKGHDEWTYKFFEGDQEHLKEVHFEYGKAVYIGDQAKPAVSAEETDKRNQDAELAAINDQASKKANLRKEVEEFDKKKGEDELQFAPEFKPLE